MSIMPSSAPAILPIHPKRPKVKKGGCSHAEHTHAGHIALEDVTEEIANHTQYALPGRDVTKETADAV
jgi:hypothetical protein